MSEKPSPKPRQARRKDGEDGGHAPQGRYASDRVRHRRACVSGEFVGGRRDKPQGEDRSQSDSEAENRAGDEPDASGPTCFMGVRCRSRPRSSEKDDTVDLDETGAREPTGQRQCRHDEEGGDRSGRGHGSGSAERPGKYEQLADESVEGRQSGDRDGPKQERRCRDGHPPREPAERFDVARTRSVNDGARTVKKKSLHEAVVEHVEQCAGVAEEGHCGQRFALAEHANADAHHNDADVLDTAVREQALEVVLRERVENSRDA